MYYKPIPDQSVIPNVQGETVEQATDILAERDLTVGDTTPTPSEEIAEARRAHHPRIGRRVDKNSSVELFVSEGPVLAVVPEMVGDSELTARNELAEAQLGVPSHRDDRAPAWRHRTSASSSRRANRPGLISSRAPIVTLTVGAEGDPITTLPPATLPPQTLPPQTLPPATVPPETQPPATDPPATQPPATVPPETQPPATDPPATQPPPTDPPETDRLHQPRQRRRRSRRQPRCRPRARHRSARRTAARRTRATRPQTTPGTDGAPPPDSCGAPTLWAGSLAGADSDPAQTRWWEGSRPDGGGADVGEDAGPD
ncbi:MAG: PASTA domain-containing protein [Ilumatobacteraceae bacterium]